MPGQATVAIRDKEWTVSVATTPSELSQGLIGVPSIPANTGMLFDLGQEQIITVSAEGMLFPVDVIFIGDNLKVTEVAFGLQPEDWGTTSLPARYFLEVNAGEAAGIEDGDDVIITYAPAVSYELIGFLFAIAMLGFMAVSVAGMAKGIGK